MRRSRRVCFVEFFPRVLSSSRYVVFIPIIGTLVASVALAFYEALVVGRFVVEAILSGDVSAKGGKSLAVGLIEAVDVFLMSIVSYIISIGFYVLFVDDSLPLPPWLKLKDLEDLKSHLLSVLIAVFAVLFLREAVARSGEMDLLSLGGAFSLMIVALTFYLLIKNKYKDNL